jgi:hypothetical protein
LLPRGAQVIERLQILLAGHLSARVAHPNERERLVETVVMTPAVMVVLPPVPAAIGEEQDDAGQDCDREAEDRPLDRARSGVVQMLGTTEDAAASHHRAQEVLSVHASIIARFVLSAHKLGLRQR